ncbi:MAG: hypothetical protein JRJ62_15060 [Deltaproteobacteria bacterium]|nr:hypothetical protein [Deltaproteobacteria bacterium]
MSLIAKASQNITDRLTWHIADRDQAGIAKNLADGQDIPEVYGLGEAGLFDEFFCFLDQFGIKDLFMGIEPISKKRKCKVPFIAVIFIYLMRIVAGLKFFWHIDPVILHSQSLMRLVGFNGRQVREAHVVVARKNLLLTPIMIKRQQKSEVLYARTLYLLT